MHLLTATHGGMVESIAAIGSYIAALKYDVVTTHVSAVEDQRVLEYQVIGLEGDVLICYFGQIFRRGVVGGQVALSVIRGHYAAYQFADNYTGAVGRICRSGFNALKRGEYGAFCAVVCHFSKNPFSKIRARAMRASRKTLSLRQRWLQLRNCCWL